MNTIPKDLPVLDVTDTENRFSRLGQSAQRIRDGVVFLGIEYSNKITGAFVSPKNANVLRLRDSILYRLHAVVFHLHLLQAIQRNHLEQLRKDPFNEENKMRILDGGRQEQVQLFDSIVFHSISLFDYLGNLMDYVCNDKGQMRLKWMGVVQSIRDPSNPLSRSPVANIIKNLHSELVDHLYKHRSDLIHYSADLAGAQTTFDLLANEHDFKVFAPYRIIRRFHELDVLSQDHRLSLNYVAFWLSDKTLDSTIQLIQPLLDHIQVNRKTPPGSAVFLYGDPTKAPS